MEMLYLLTDHSRLVWYVVDSTVVKSAFTSQLDMHGTHPLDGDEEVDDVIEDPGIFGRDTWTGKVQKWLKGLCHWHRAFVDLGSGGAVAHLLGPRQLRIEIVELMPITKPTQQAPLSKTLIALEPQNRGFAGVAQDSLRYQTQRAKDDGALGMVLAGDGSRDDEWIEMFTGHVHCEAYLACSQTQSSIKEIGVSKRCCFCCAVFLDTLNPRLTYTGTHGKVHPWAPPANAPRTAKEAVLKALQNKLFEHFDIRRRSGDSGAGSDDDAVVGVKVPKISIRRPPPMKLRRS
ncbi:hypothetical protein FRB95_008120 [Tulasnella sp. JGI-2019a]|nr:hypothetical protein FRB95_008120 [Tulasnella sp. JGI-2019a]